MNLNELEEVNAIAAQLEDLRGARAALPDDDAILSALAENPQGLRINLHLGHSGVSAPIPSYLHLTYVQNLRSFMTDLECELVSKLAGFGVNAEQQAPQPGTDDQGVAEPSAEAALH